MGSTLVATLSAMMAQHRMYLEESAQKRRQLHNYLDQEQIPLELAMATKLQVLTVLGQRKRPKAKETGHLAWCLVLC